MLHDMDYMIAFCLCCGDSTFSEQTLKMLLNIIPLNISTQSSFHKYQTINNNPVYFIYCGQNVEVTCYTLNDCIE